MNTDRTFMPKLFEEKELEKLNSALARDKVIIPALLKVMQYRFDQHMKPASLSDFKNTAWPLEKAFLDGKANELQWLHDFLNKE